ncbi:hypothetical protein O0I10_006856 [Lichtheimia ornata]|uniref:PPPDE domain-containing protein n=1 Tax=Lichtheimia ornata TaxID=688661 RepID=A0AAD7V2G3_9FUNG|nr:uncharacterized protein O0I10_006856 [Lichtheimia ornata]KAJ8657554.1 hypothetical protein O0I10_006856 [Lichtheimia ornata]
MFQRTYNSLLGQSTDPEMQNKLQVFVNVYDMLEPSLLTNVGYALGVGIFHSGVEVAGREYCFGGHEYENLTGVFAVEPKIGPPGVLFKQSIPMGYIDMSDQEIEQVLYAVSEDFGGTTYNLLTRNCNHFTEDLCSRLTGKSIPGWINRAARLGAMFPCVVPDEWIEPPEFEADSTTGSPNQPASPTLSDSSTAPLRQRTINRRNSLSHHFRQHQGNANSSHEDIVFMRPASPVVDNLNDSVKEPDSSTRSATQLSIDASFHEINRSTSSS